MNGSLVMARLAVHELWISFRLFIVLTAFVLAGAAVALIPSALPRTMEALAAGLGAATALTAAVAAWSLAVERHAGRAGWLVTRSLSRSALLTGWFIGLASIVLPALAAAFLLGWFAAAGVTVRLDPAEYAALVAGVATTALAALAAGLLAGALVPPVPAAIVGAALVGAAIAGGWLTPGDTSIVPGGAYAAAARLAEPGVDVATGLRATGSGLAATAVLLVVARVLLHRAEL